tara:strand:- start:242 stop:436 length:195 start_codon:yes stop_codon:yes gene_type:complete
MNVSGYTKILIDVLNKELESTDVTGEMLLPILEEILSVNNYQGRELLVEKLLVEARIFNMLIKS